MKDLAWLKEEVKKLKVTKLNYDEVGMSVLNKVFVDKHEVMYLMSKVEQPELPMIPDGLKVDMQVGFDGGVEGYSNVSIPEAVEILGDYDVTVQQPELPVIPDYVAEWLEKHKEQDLYWLLNTLYQHVTEIDDWFVDNVEKLIDAKRYGYTVEEKKYRVWNGENIPLIMKGFDDEIIEVGDPQNEENYVGDLNRIFDTCLTKQEIKDYDERYFAFAVPVEEEEWT